jgi:nitroreductase
VDEFVARANASLPQPAPDALVVLTAAFHRLARKYGPFAYRLANLDAGTALAQLHVAAQALRIRSQTLTRWADDVVEQQLELVPLEEQVTAVVALSRGEPQRRAAEVSLCAAPTAQPPRDARPARDFGQLSPGDVLELLYRESRVSESRLRQATGRVPPELRAIAPADFALTLPAPGRGGQPVGPLLRQRVTVRHYAKRQVPVEALGAMLHSAQAGDARDWPQEHDDDLGLGLEVLAAGVAGIAPGVYRYVAAEHALRLDSPLPGREQLVDLLVQEEYASAPLLVLILGNLAAACRRHGAFGHRQLLLRAGAAGQRLWTAAMALGLAGSVFAGLVGGAARRRFGFDGYREAALFAFAAGHAASASSDSPT